MALLLFLRDPETCWPDALAWLLLAWGCVALALAWRARMQP
jgi:CHASE2 domain-containing sensor protein